MPAYLKIENPGVAPAEAFTLLGASTKDGTGNVIGRFGSGNKHGIAVLLRHNLAPTVFAGNLKLEFGTRPQKVNDGIREKSFDRVVVKFGGKDVDGTSRSATEDLGYVVSYGASDWTTVDLALREFVSNSIDRAIEEGESKFITDWVSDNPGRWVDGKWASDEGKEEFNAALKAYRGKARDFERVTVEVVAENQVRAKSGTTRVFVPMNEDVFKFYNNLGKWFLHFSEPGLLNTVLLPKANRNLSDRKAAVIYRRGVRVREFESSNTPSLFDYNLPNLEMDEARKVDDWKVRQAAGRAMVDAEPKELATLFQSFKDGSKYWEHGFDEYALEPSFHDNDKTVAARKEKWVKAFDLVAGSAGVLATAEGGQVAARKGYSVVPVPTAFVKAGASYGVRTPDKVLSQDDREGREVLDPTPDAQAAVDFVWEVIQKAGMTNGRPKPPVKSFRQVMDGGAQTLGYWRDDTVFLNTDIAGSASLVVPGAVGLSHQLLTTALEECSHHATKAADGSRDFQDYVLNLATHLAKNS